MRVEDREILRRAVKKTSRKTTCYTTGVELPPGEYFAVVTRSYYGHFTQSQVSHDELLLLFFYLTGKKYLKKSVYEALMSKYTAEGI
jgi:hypothetical protein